MKTLLSAIAILMIATAANAEADGDNCAAQRPIKVPDANGGYVTAYLNTDRGWCSSSPSGVENSVFAPGSGGDAGNTGSSGDSGAGGTGGASR